MISRLVTLVGIFSLRASGILLQMLVLLLVGRIIGPAGVGAMQTFLSWTTTLGETAAAGLPVEAMRRYARKGPGERQLFRDYLRRIGSLTLLVFAGGCLALLAELLELGAALAPLLLSVPAFAVARLGAEGLKARGRIVFGIAVETAGSPALAFLTLTAGYLNWLTITPVMITGAYAAGFLAAACMLALRLYADLSASGDAPPLKWVDHSPFWITSLVSIVFLNLPFLLLPLFASAEEIGAFALAFKLLNIVTTILIMLGALYGPKFARCAQDDDIAGMFGLLRQTQLVSAALYLPVALMLILFYDRIHPIFGPGFESGGAFLIALAVGQGVNAATGLPGLMLNMSGHGRTEAIILSIALALALAATLVAGAALGAEGIAWVCAAAAAGKSIASWTAAHLLHGGFLTTDARRMQEISP